MNMKSFLLGVVTGAVLTFAVLFVIGTANQGSQGDDRIKYLEQPVSYEGKTETSFQVFQVFDDAALAIEESKTFSADVVYHGNTVLILGEDFYSDQIVTVKNPQRLGTYSYTANNGMPKTVPVIDGELTSRNK